MTARDLIKPIIDIYESQKDKLNEKELANAELMVDILRDWKGEMTEDSVPATVYSYW